MGIYLPNMEMPKDCPMCPLAHYNTLGDFTGCNITPGKRYAMTHDKEYAESSTRPAWCPLVEVPTPHRRLIEEPELFYYGGLAKISPLDFIGTAKYFSDQVKVMSTIIEAEGV